MLRRLLQCVTLVSLLAGGAAAQENTGQWIRGVYTGESPRPVTLTESEAWEQASTLAGYTPRAFVLVGSGKSMQPLYSPGTILVLRQLAYQELKRGQTVLYRNKENRVVAHVLVAKARDGWRARGLNNRIHDMEPVHADNLVGVVVAAYKPVSRRPVLTMATLTAAHRPGLN